MLTEPLLCSMSFNYHDSSAAFAVNNTIILVIEAERVFRQKKKRCNQEEMEYLVQYGLTLLGRDVDSVTYWSMTTLRNPYLSVADIADLDTHALRDPYWKTITLFGSKRNVLIVNHHFAHAGIYLSTEFDNAIIISCDGGGDFDPNTGRLECLAVFRGNNLNITKQTSYSEEFVTGKTYGVCSKFVYGHDLQLPTSSEGKLMALAGLGRVRDEYYDFLEGAFKEIEATDYATVMRILDTSLSSLRGQASLPTDAAKDFAATVHIFFINKRLYNTRNIIEKMASGEEAIILTGGASLNIDLNTQVARLYPAFRHFIAPCCDDTGQSLGALCILISRALGVRPFVEFPYLGEGQQHYSFTAETLSSAVDILLNDGILLLHNGKSELGPRALGNRSFIARPDRLYVKQRLSEHIKQRESYRPVAPVVLEEKTSDYFRGPHRSPFMLYRYDVIPSRIDNVIGAVHADNSARVQTLARTSNPFLYDLTRAFGDITGTYALLNTSLNLRGEPLANTWNDTLRIYGTIEGTKGVVFNGSLVSALH